MGMQAYGPELPTGAVRQKTMHTIEYIQMSNDNVHLKIIFVLITVTPNKLNKKKNSKKKEKAFNYKKIKIKQH